MRNHDWTNNKATTKTNTETKTLTKTMLNTFREHLQRAIFETFDLWNIWLEWWGNMIWSKVSKAKSLKDCSLKVFPKCNCHCHCLCICICLRRCLFVGQVMFSHRSDQMSQRPKVSKIALWRCSLNVFVIVIVFLFVFVFVVIFLLVRSRFLIALIKCLKGQKPQRLLFEGVL